MRKYIITAIVAALAFGAGFAGAVISNPFTEAEQALDKFQEHLTTQTRLSNDAKAQIIASSLAVDTLVTNAVSPNGVATVIDALAVASPEDAAVQALKARKDAIAAEAVAAQTALAARKTAIEAVQ